jgi:hypothetical protein
VDQRYPLHPCRLTRVRVNVNTGNTCYFDSNVFAGILATAGMIGMYDVCIDRSLHWDDYRIGADNMDWLVPLHDKLCCGAAGIRHLANDAGCRWATISGFGCIRPESSRRITSLYGSG